jgi:hypothetical protein
LKAALSLILVFAAQAYCAAWFSTHRPNLVGRWKVEFTFANQAGRSLRFDALASGKGSLLQQDPKSSLTEPAEPSAAEWAQSGEGRVTFSGPVEFPIGNVGREQGTLFFKGRFETEDSISGEVAFFPAGQDPKDSKAAPSKSGTFKATRVTKPDASR